MKRARRSSVPSGTWLVGAVAVLLGGGVLLFSSSHDNLLPGVHSRSLHSRRSASLQAGRSRSSLLHPERTATSKPSSSPKEKTGDSSPFVIILDGGSTGSRLHIFEFVRPSEEDSDTPASKDGTNTSSANTTSNSNDNAEEIVRRGTARADRPLSAFVGASPQELADYLMPTFRYAAQQIPADFIPTTRVLYQATAGMRLLTVPQQEEIYDRLYLGLVQHADFGFSLHRDDIATLSGDLEGYYGALAANFLHGTINTQLELIHDQNSIGSGSSGGGRGIVGALDMGGSSTQIVYLPQQHHHHHYRPPHANAVDQDDTDKDIDDVVCREYGSEDMVPDECHVATRDEYPRVLQGEDFFAVSYLSYGADQFRERLWTTWITEWQALHGSPSTCDAHILPNPCAFKGYVAEWQGYKLVGTGEAHKCVREVQRHIPHPEETLEELNEETSTEKMVGGIAHPPVHGKFVAMSLYFFTLDTLRALSHPDKEAYEALNLSWPNPSIEELYNALDGLCSRQWQGDLEEIQHNAHPFTKAEVLPHRCMEAVYIVTLLRDGFGFPPESRDITFTFLVDGSEVEWTLGMALQMRTEERFAQGSPVASVTEPASSPSSSSPQGRSHDASVNLNLTHNRQPSSDTSCTEEAALVEDFRREIICHPTS